MKYSFAQIDVTLQFNLPPTKLLNIQMKVKGYKISLYFWDNIPYPHLENHHPLVDALWVQMNIKLQLSVSRYHTFKA